MKKRAVRLLLLTLCLCLLMGCAATGPATSPNASPSSGIGNMGNAGKETPAAPTPEPAPEATPLSRNPDTLLEKRPEYFYDEAMAKLANIAKRCDLVKRNVPVYWLDELIMAKSGESIINPGRDYGYMTAEYPETGAGRIDVLMYRLPTEAIRGMENGDYIYFMYDTDEGHRVYLFANRKDGGATHYYYGRLSGLLVIMAKTLSYEDYAGVERGMEISDLARFDPAMQVFSDYFYAKHAKEEGVASWKDYGIPPTTISILKDGALKITFDYVDEKFVVDTIEFSEDFTFEGYYETICYRIAEVDYKE